MSRITRDRRPARSVTRTEIVPALVPGGTRATHPVGERLSLVASAPFDQRKLTRIPALRPVPRSWTCLPIMTCGRGWQTARVAGTHRSPVSFGGGVRAGRPWARAPRRAGSRSRGCVRAASSVTTDRTRRSRAGVAVRQPIGGPTRFSPALAPVRRLGLSQRRHAHLSDHPSPRAASGRAKRACPGGAWPKAWDSRVARTRAAVVQTAQYALRKPSRAIESVDSRTSSSSVERWTRRDITHRRRNRRRLGRARSGRRRRP